MPYEPIITVLLGLVTALIGYTELIQKERGYGRERPLLSVRAEAAPNGRIRLRVGNVGGRTALHVHVHHAGSEIRFDAIEPGGQEVLVAPPEVSVLDLRIDYSEPSGRPCAAFRSFRRHADGALAYVQGHDERRRLLERASSWEQRRLGPPQQEPDERR